MKAIKNLKYYLVLSYFMFWLLLGITGYLISLEVPVLVQSIMKNVCAWTPTFVILIIFNKLYPLQLVLIEQIQLLMSVSVGYMLAAIILILTQKQSLLAKPGVDSIYTN